MELLLGIDIGTSGARAGIFDRNGNSLIFCEKSIPLYTPHSGWAEQDPDDWWQAVGAACRQAI